MTRPSLLLLAGSAGCGKDTFYALLHDYLSDHMVTRYAFADELKRELDPMFRAFGATAFETDPHLKTLIRPILVAYGCAMRVLTNGAYWVDKLDPAVKAAMARDELVVVSDARFPNEVVWGKSLGAKVIYLERIGPDGKLVAPANKDETENDPYLRANADLTVSWPTTDREALVAYVARATQDLGLQ